MLVSLGVAIGVHTQRSQHPSGQRVEVTVCPLGQLTHRWMGQGEDVGRGEMVGRVVLVFVGGESVRVRVAMGGETIPSRCATTVLAKKRAPMSTANLQGKQ